MSPDQTFQTALQLHQSGHLAQADALYQQILTLNPNHAGALHLSGLVAWKSGDRGRALSLLRRAVELAPQETAFLGNLSKLLTELRQHEEAIASAGRVVALSPDNATSHFDLASALQSAGAAEESIAAYHQCLRLNGAYVGAHNNLGVLLKSQGRLDQAVACFERALALDPHSALAHANLGETCQALGDHARAVVCLRQATRLAPQNPAMHFALGVSLFELRLADPTIAAYRRAIELAPENPIPYNNLGIALRELGRLDEAEDAYRQALRLNPNLVEPLTNLGIVLSAKGDPAAIAVHRRAVELNPSQPTAYSNLLYTLHFDPSSTPQSLLAEHRQWSWRCAQPPASAIKPWPNDQNPDRRLRIGYVSPDLYAHAVGRFMLPLLANHDHSAYEIHCFTDLRYPDALTQRLRGHADHWHSIRGMSHRDVAEVIRQRKIDILVDLTMHLDGSRLLVFAEKPAPLQVTYLAYCSTTGLDTIDYRFTDRFLDPPGTDPWYTEKSIRLETYWCYDAPGNAPDVNPLPALKTGNITFGCLNNFMKISPMVLETWAQLLASVPRSRLLLHADAGDHRKRVHSVLAAAGIAPDRCQFAPQVQTHDYFRLYHQIDIGLDPFPYAGGTTTCDALWMGVPVVTLAGGTAVGRGGVSILSQVGLTDLIAGDVDQYVQIIKQLASDPPRLQQLRAGLREQMRSSPLMDAPRFARTIESAYRQIWQHWCSTR